MQLYNCSICGQKDVEVGECIGRCHKEIYKSALSEGIWLGIGIGMVSASIMIGILEFFG